MQPKQHERCVLTLWGRSRRTELFGDLGTVLPEPADPSVLVVIPASQWFGGSVAFHPVWHKKCRHGKVVVCPWLEVPI